MTSRIPCEYCGWPEIDHIAFKAGTLVSYFDPSKLQDGYLFTLQECEEMGGFVIPSQPRAQKQQATT